MNSSKSAHLHSGFRGNTAWMFRLLQEPRLDSQTRQPRNPLAFVHIRCWKRRRWNLPCCFLPFSFSFFGQGFRHESSLLRIPWSKIFATKLGDLSLSANSLLNAYVCNVFVVSVLARGSIRMGLISEKSHYTSLISPWQEYMLHIVWITHAFHDWYLTEIAVTASHHNQCLRQAN